MEGKTEDWELQKSSQKLIMYCCTDKGLIFPFKIFFSFQKYSGKRSAPRSIWTCTSTARRFASNCWCSAWRRWGILMPCGQSVRHWHCYTHAFCAWWVKLYVSRFEITFLLLVITVPNQICMKVCSFEGIRQWHNILTKWPDVHQGLRIFLVLL